MEYSNTITVNLDGFNFIVNGKVKSVPKKQFRLENSLDAASISKFKALNQFNQDLVSFREEFEWRKKEANFKVVKISSYMWDRFVNTYANYYQQESVEPRAIAIDYEGVPLLLDETLIQERMSFI